MINRRLQIRKPQSKNFALKGGLNTEIAGIERSPGEMAISKNYICAEGSYNGYQSLKGYERFDGNTAPSDVALETYTAWADATAYVEYDRVSHGGYVFYCILDHTSATGVNEPDSVTPGDNTWWVNEGLISAVNEFEDRGREAARTAIKKVGDAQSATGKVRGMHVHNSLVYAWRNTSGSANTGLWVSSATGWSQVLPDSTAMTASGDIKAITARFREYPPSDPAEEVMYWIDGVTEGFFYLDPVSGTYKNVTHANMPSGYAPQHIGVWENRLFLCYEDGYTIFSNTGQPQNFDSATGTAGDIDFNEPVTGITVAAGKLIVFTRKFIKIVHKGSSGTQFVWDTDTFSETMGAFVDTIQNINEQIFFCDDRGIQGLFTSAETGGFSAKPVSQKVDTEYQGRKLSLQSSIKDIAKRRYYIFYANADATHEAIISASGIKDSTGDSLMFFGDTLGYVYQMEKGTSMDGETLDTYMVSGFYHYGSPGYWKHFERLQFEISCAENTDFTIGTIYEYGSPLLPNTNTQTEQVSGGAAVWGGGITWGTFTWGAGHLGRALVYIQGYSTNMAVTMSTSSKYKTIHTIHNIMANYSMGDVRQ
jgi:hypothetical protein